MDVQSISDDAIRNSASVRFEGKRAASVNLGQKLLFLFRCSEVTAEEFVHSDGFRDNSFYQSFRSLVARKLDVAMANVDVFSVTNLDRRRRAVDVRFAVHGSPYLRRVKLEAVIRSSRREVCAAML